MTPLSQTSEPVAPEPLSEPRESLAHATAYDASAAALWGELYGPEQLAAHARDLAVRHRRFPLRRKAKTSGFLPRLDLLLQSRKLPLLRRLNETEAAIGAVRARLHAAAGKGTDMSPAGAWLLDNYFIVLEHAREIRATMSREFYGRLPKLTGGPHAGLPRAYDIAIELVAHTDGRLDAETITRMLVEYQRITPLTLAELWAMPAMLRMSLLENVRRMALRADRDITDAETADRWVRRLRSQHGTELAAALSAFVRQPPDLTPAFLARFLQQLRADNADFTPLLWLEQWITEEGMSPDEAMRRSMQRLSLSQLIMANSITSLRMVAGFDWAPFVESMSATEAVLRRDPAGIYGGMTFETRDRYRHVVEEVAAATARSEPEIAEAVISLAEAGNAPAAETGADPRRRHVGFYLVAAGRAELDAAVSYSPPPSERGQRWVCRQPTLAYFGTLAVLVVIAMALLLAPLPAGAGLGIWLLAVVLVAIPASELALSFINQLVTLSFPPHRMSRLDYRRGVPPADRTLVVVPLLVPSASAIKRDLERLEAQYLANRDVEIRFALLGDFLDADREHMPTDDEIVATAVETVRSLNAKYATATRRGPFYYFHRPRRWNSGERAWMGWERKRGKLADLNAFVRGGARDAFSVVEGDLAWVRHVRYVITLDSDTTLPVGAAARLVGTMAHPLNRPVIDPSSNRVVRGYGIMQPRVSVSLESANRSRFAAIFSGHPGVDPYTTAVSDVYQDLFGEGTFTGKGIYDVDVFARSTAGRFPENTLLSHDLIEGAFARAGLVTDVEVFDDYPTQYLAAALRDHRWIRGDWQLLRWLTGTIPGPNDATGSVPSTASAPAATPNPLSALSKWKVADNLRRSILPVVTFLWLVLGWTVLPGGAYAWTLAVLASLLFPLAFGLLLDAINPPRREAPRSWRPFYLALWQDSSNALKQFALDVMLLPHQAQIAADAVLRTLWRLFVSKRHLLEWITASQSDRSSLRSRAALWRHMGPAAVVGALVALNASLVGAPALLALVFGVAWIASPEIIRLLAAPRHRGRALLSAGDRELALRYAKIHWNYFDRFVGDSTAWLAPDNVQETPQETIALRTSPTNIGLQLLSTVAAHELEFISRTEMLDRLERAFATLARMRRFRGHLYNWYALPTLEVLDPPYVSTVDSGNFAGHLIALAEGLRDVAEAVPAHTPRDAAEVQQLHAIAERARTLAAETDFSLLYDPQRKLFSIGYDERAARLDPSSYDLLASEARLTSFVAIAKGDVPAEHWFHLGRTLTTTGTATALVSWSGSMFEYLMPVLVLPSRRLSLLDQTHRAATRRQEVYGRARGTPWGISESAYNLRDRHGTYQYRAFGVPDLALMRGLVSDLVIAPYATMLALLVDPAAAFRNLQALEKTGALGTYGFYDAIDYTRHPPGDRLAMVRTFMAHHIGMSLISLHHTLDIEGTEGVWQRRFMADPASQAAALLLDERVPRHYIAAPAQSDVADERAEPVRTAPPEPIVRHYETAMTAEPRIALLGASSYSVLVTNSGAGYSRAAEMAVTRWRADGTRDDTGSWIYVKDVSTDTYWSASHQPTAVLADAYDVTFATDRVVFRRRDGDIETMLEIAVSPRDRAETRVVTVTNRSEVNRDIDVTSYAEVVLTSPDADRAHPAFQNLFIETEWIENSSAIIAGRRPRSAQEKRAWCAHVVATGPERVGDLSCETDRAAFIGRGRSARAPRALDPNVALTGSVGAVLDPIVSIRARVRVEPGRSAKVAFTTLVGDERNEVLDCAGRYSDLHASERAISLAVTEAQVELRDRGITPSQATLFQEMAAALIYPNEELRASALERAENRRGQQTLWAHGISGDWPIILATIDCDAGLETMRHLLSAHEYWRTKGIIADLVVLDTKPASYRQDFADQLGSIVIASTEGFLLDKPGGVFIRRSDVMTDEDLTMLRATARVHIPCDGADLATRAPSLSASDNPATSAAPGQMVTALQRPAAPAARQSQILDNGFGHATDDGAYEIRVRGRCVPPAPWINVIANPLAGFCVTERGGGFAWVENSFFYRLTPWHNDPVCDPLGEVLYLQDADAADPYQAWTPTPGPHDASDTGNHGGAEYVVRHAPGLTTFVHERHGIATHLAMGVPTSDPLKISRLKITNTSDRRRTLTLTSYVEWTLGAQREHTRHQIFTRRDESTGAVFANNFFTDDFASRVAFSHISEPTTGFTANREEFIGRNGDLSRPAAMVAPRLLASTGAGFDPCAAFRCAITLAPQESRDIVLLLGAAANEDDARSLIARYTAPHDAHAALNDAVAAWERRLSTITAHTPSAEFDSLANRWSLYQALSCRMWARSALYQSSGAYGFRDQLQDCMAFVYAEPGIARAHLLLAASRQFREGDVQHWWHEPSGRGVRTRFSDDLAWLPFVADHYVRVTGDTSVWDERIPFLEQRPLRPDEHDAYDRPSVSEDVGTLYEHCVRALDRASTEGPHGLPLIGGGDWNDGMDRVGVEGKGESIWLAWFLIATLRRTAEHADGRGDAAAAARFRAHATRYAEAADRDGWDGAWYRRAFFDDGTPLGSASSEECQIDAIAQSWSIISAAGDADRTRRAMQSVNERLVDRDARLIKLLTPPFDRMAHDPGYIKGYVPGVRENGAQYTHAALWTAMATALAGDGDRAFELFEMLNPLSHSRTRDDVERYKVEPYAICADVYTADGHVGRGGWTWYTGSASWTYRVAFETILGFTKRGDALTIDPCVPASWKEFSIHYRFGDTMYEIVVKNPQGQMRGVARVEVDGESNPDKKIRLVDDHARHSVTVFMND